MKKVLKLAIVAASIVAPAPVLAKAPAKRVAVHSDEWQRHRAIEESLGRMQLDNLIAKIVDDEGKHPLRLQRAALVKANPAS